MINTEILENNLYKKIHEFKRIHRGAQGMMNVVKRIQTTLVLQFSYPSGDLEAGFSKLKVFRRFFCQINCC